MDQLEEIRRRKAELSEEVDDEVKRVVRDLIDRYEEALRQLAQM